MAETINTNSYPEYAYTFQVMELNAQSGSAGILIRYIPENANLTSIIFNIPIEADFNPQNMSTYVDKWAPRQQWFAQEMVLNYADIIVSSSTAANTVYQN